MQRTDLSESHSGSWRIFYWKSQNWRIIMFVEPKSWPLPPAGSSCRLLPSPPPAAGEGGVNTHLSANTQHSLKQSANTQQSPLPSANTQHSPLLSANTQHSKPGSWTLGSNSRPLNTHWAKTSVSVSVSAKVPSWHLYSCPMTAGIIPQWNAVCYGAWLAGVGPLYYW